MKELKRSVSEIVSEIKRIQLPGPNQTAASEVTTGSDYTETLDPAMYNRIQLLLAAIEKRIPSKSTVYEFLPLTAVDRFCTFFHDSGIFYEATHASGGKRRYETVSKCVLTDCQILWLYIQICCWLSALYIYSHLCCWLSALYY